MFFGNRKSMRIVAIAIASLLVVSMVLGAILSF